MRRSLPSVAQLLSTFVLLSLGLTLSACAPAPQTGEDVVVFLVRHAEKADDPSDDPPLTEVGEARAAALAFLLSDAGLTHIHSTPTRRTMDTASPVQEVTGLGVEPYQGGELGQLAAALRSTPGRHLVVGHSNTTPALVGLLGGDPGVPMEDSEYDRFYVLTLHPSGSVATVVLRLATQAANPMSP
ncbi:histidine phosphatase family protein [Gemmatimonadota bacterium]